jgi:DNA-binding CsgD family transcriptional regulator
VVAGGAYRYVSYELGPVARPPGLSDAEAQIVELVMRGVSSTRIARERGVTARTVAKQLASIYRKVGVGSRAELVFALRARITST